MRIKQLVHEDFVNYKKPSMLIGTSYCTGKCYKELGLPCTICQNEALQRAETLDISFARITSMYINNPITQAIVLGGLEPFDQFDDIYNLIAYFRGQGDESYFIIYTGYNEDEVSSEISKLRPLKNIIVKFGRYIPNQKSHYDEILGVSLASDNQYAKIIC